MAPSRTEELKFCPKISTPSVMHFATSNAHHQLESLMGIQKHKSAKAKLVADLFGAGLNLCQNLPEQDLAP